MALVGIRGVEVDTKCGTGTASAGSGAPSSVSVVSSKPIAAFVAVKVLSLLGEDIGGAI